MLQIVKTDYIDKLKESISDAVAKVLEKPTDPKREEKLIKYISPIISEILPFIVLIFKRLLKEYEDYKWQWKGRRMMVKNTEKEIAIKNTYLKKAYKELEEKTSEIKQLKKEIKQIIKERDRHKNRLYKKWDNLKKWIKSRIKNTVKKYSDKKRKEFKKIKAKIKIRNKK